MGELRIARLPNYVRTPMDCALAPTEKITMHATMLKRTKKKGKTAKKENPTTLYRLMGQDITCFRKRGLKTDTHGDIKLTLCQTNVIAVRKISNQSNPNRL